MLTNELEGVNKDVYKTDWQWQEGEYTVTRTNMWTAPGCHNGCSVLYYTKDGKVEKIEGDPLSPYNQGRLCMRCLDVVETFYHPDRLKYPLRRVGERGENKWERITWDEAYDDIVEHVHQIWEEYGPESILSIQGTGRNGSLGRSRCRGRRVRDEYIVALLQGIARHAHVWVGLYKLIDGQPVVTGYSVDSLAFLHLVHLAPFLAALRRRDDTESKRRNDEQASC